MVGSVLLLLTLSGTPTSLAKPLKDDVIRESVDLIELNHFYDEHGRLVFDQVIFYDWHENSKLIPQFKPIIDEEGLAAWKKLNMDVPFNVKELEQEFGNRYNVRAWRLVKHPSQLPQRDWETGVYQAMWQDGEQIRYICSKEIRETWTQYDPELLEREYLPKEKRRELFTPKPLPKVKKIEQTNTESAQ